MSGCASAILGRPLWPHRLAIASLAVLLSGVYASGLHPGVADGDSAELQWAGPLLGICHSPGYALQVSFLKLFGALPIGGSLAWRANVMSAVFGIVGCLALYGSVRRITGRVLPGCIAATTLAFSSVFWSHALVAETYVFGASFILLAVYTAVRFVESDRSPWLWATALLLGVAVAERLPELLIVPAFLALWLAFRRQVRLDWRRASICAGLMALPLVLAVGLNVARSDPERLPARDDALRDAIIGYHPHEVTYDYGAGPGLVERLQSATSFVLGVRWSARVGTSHIGGTSLKYAWLLSGLGVWGDRFAPEVDHDFMLRGALAWGRSACCWRWRESSSGGEDRAGCCSVWASGPAIWLSCSCTTRGTT